MTRDGKQKGPPRPPQAPPADEDSAFDPLLPRSVFASETRAPESKARPRRGSTGTGTGQPPPREPSTKGDQAMDLQKLPRAGAVLGKYRLEELLGLGGFAAVYRATHLLLSMPVALKVLRPSVLRKRPLLGELLCTEGRFAAMINHPHIVRVHDVVQEKSLTYLVMEYVDGMTLAKKIALNGPLAPLEVLRLGREMAEGLKAGVERGLMHRDVKPANILISKAGESKLLDFGFAIATSSGVPGQAESYFGRNCIVGTRGYMAPEQETAPSSVDFRADMYSLGVTMYEAARGCLPPSGARPDSTSRRPRAASTREVPLPLSRLIERLTGATPDLRPSTYDELLRHLAATAAELSA